jgi:hypothetical protein
MPIKIYFVFLLLFLAAFLRGADFLARVLLFPGADFLARVLFFRGADFFFAAVRFFGAAFFAVFFFGTLAPFFLASDNPMAIACFRDFTFLPLLPLFNSPLFISCIARLTFF